MSDPEVQSARELIASNQKVVDELNALLARKQLEFQVIQSLSSEINTTLDLNRIFELAMGSLDQMFGFKHSLVLLKDRRADQLKVAASHGYQGQGIGAVVPLGQGVIGVVARHRKVMRSVGLGYQAAYARALGQKMALDAKTVVLPGLQDVKSQLAIPLLIKDELIGVYAVESAEANAFDALDELILGIVGSQLGAAIANARAYQEISDLTANLELRVAERTRAAEEARADTEILADLARRANASQDLDDILWVVEEIARTRFGADAMAFFMLDADGSALTLRAQILSGQPLAQELIPQILNRLPLTAESGTLFRTFQKKKPLHLSRIREEWLRSRGSAADAALFATLQCQWVLQLPLIAEGQVIAICGIAGKEARRLLQSDIHFLERVGAQVAGAVRTVELLHQARAARAASDKLLLSILPQRIAEELKREGSVEPLFYDIVSVLFTDFVGFTEVAERMRPDELVFELDGCFSYFDDVVQRNQLEKLKTIGDSYMCAAGVPKLSPTHAVDACLAALEFRNFIDQMAEIKKGLGHPFWQLRIGIHSGPVIGGVIGKDKFAFDIWGDTVNTASRMETSGQPEKINISGATFQLVQDFFDCEYRGQIDAKGKGMVPMYFLLRIKSELSVEGLGLVPNAAFEQKRFELIPQI